MVLILFMSQFLSIYFTADIVVSWVIHAGYDYVRV